MQQRSNRQTDSVVVNIACKMCQRHACPSKAQAKAACGSDHPPLDRSSSECLLRRKRSPPLSYFLGAVAMAGSTQRQRQQRPDERMTEWRALARSHFPPDCVCVCETAAFRCVSARALSPPSIHPSNRCVDPTLPMNRAFGVGWMDGWGLQLLAAAVAEACIALSRRPPTPTQAMPLTNLTHQPDHHPDHRLAS